MTSKSLNLSTIGFRIFLLCLVTFLLPIGTWAEAITSEGVFFNETEITASNASSIMGTGVSYNEDSRILTLNNATVTGSLVTYGTDLTISLAGDNTFNGTLYGYGCDGKSAGVLTLANALGEPCSLQLTSGSTTSVATGFDNFTYSCFDALTADGVQYLNWTYQNYGDPHSLMYYKNGLKPATDVTFTSGYGLQVGTTVTANNAMDILEDGGSVVYDYSTKTLTLTNATISNDYYIVWGNTIDLNINIIGDNSIAGTITGCGSGALSIIRDAAGTDCSLTVGNSQSYSPCISNFSDVTAEDLNISTAELGGMVEEGSEPLNPMFNSRKIVFTTATLYDIWIGSDQVTSQNKDNILGEVTEDEQPTLSFDPETSTLTMNTANMELPYLEMTSPSITIGMDLTVQLVGESYLSCDLTVKSGYTVIFTTDEDTPGSLQVMGNISGNVVYENGLSYMPNSEYGGTIGIDNSVHYDLWIAGIQVTENTAENFFGDYSVSWNNETSTLTLSDATIGMAIDGEGEMREAPGIIYKGTDNLTINLIGTNRIYGAWGCEAILYDGESERVPQLVFSNDDSRTCSLLLSTEGDELISGFTEINYGGLYHITDVIEGEEVTISTITITSTLMGGGSGTASDPYLIKTKEDLRDFAKYNNQGVISRQAFVKLNNEINCEDLTGFEPIGNSDNAFEGTFDGNNCTISHLEYVADEDAEYAGLFGALSGMGVIKKLTLSDCSFTGGNNAGAVVAYMYGGTVEDCNVSNCVVETGSTQNPMAGGVAGEIYEGTVQRCKVFGSTITGATTYSLEGGMANAGGISGYINTGTIASCEVENSAISSSHAVAGGYQTAGGIIGRCEFDASGEYPVTISGNAVKNTTTVSSEVKTSGDEYEIALAGAIVGYHKAITLTNNTYEFTVSVSTKNPGDEAATVLTGYQHRGSGGYTDYEGSDGYPEFVASSSDIFEDNGAVLANTKKVTLPGETSEYTVMGEEGTYYNNVEDGILVVPGQTVTLSAYPGDGYTIESLTVTNTSTETTITTESEEMGDNITQYTFEMPDAPVTVTVTTSQCFPIWVAGQEVTSANARDILGDGKVSWDNETSTLTLNNATIGSAVSEIIEGDEGLMEAAGIDYKGTDNLTISLIGTNAIYGTGNCEAIRYNGLAERTPKLVFTKGDDQSCSLLLNAGEETVISYFSDIEYNDVALVVEGDIDPSYSDLNGMVCLNYYAGNNTYLPITSATVTSYTSYDLYVSGERVTSLNMNKIAKNQGANNSISFDGNHTLTFNNVPYNCFQSPFIQTSMDLTIHLIGTSQPDCGSSLIERIDGDNTTHTLTFTTDEANPGMLLFRGGYAHDGFQLAFQNGLSWNPVGYFDESSSDAPYAWIAQSLPEVYGLTVAGVEVTEENAKNITGDLIVGDGTVSFEPETNTLFMTGDVLIGNGGVAWNGNGDLTIQFVGTENRISSLTTNAVYSTSADAAFNLILQEGSDEAPCELTLQTPENTDIIGSGFTKVYREVSRLVDYNLTVTAQDATGAPAQWHALCVTTQFDAPVLWLDPDSETPKAVVSLGLFPGATFERQYNDVTLYTSTDGRNFNVYTEPVAVSVASPMIYARAQVRNVVSPIARGKYIGFAPQTSTVLVGTSFTPEMTQIGNGDGLSFNPDAVVYESSNPNVALFTDGVVTTVGVGTVTLTANIQQAVDVADETSYAYPLVVNDGILSFNLAVSPIDYNIWVKGIRVNSANKDNVLNDANATVRFNPVTNSLLFYGANVSINPGDTTSLVRCALSEGLTVELRGTNTLAFSAGFRNMLNTNVPLTFTTNDTKPGQLSWTIQNDVEGFFSTGFNIGYEADLELQTSGDLISVTPPVDYGLLVGSTVVTSVNCTDILGDGTVKYTDANKTLVLNDATLTVPVVSGLSQLKVYLQGESTISGTENMLSSSVANAPLTFTTSASAPGKLTLIKTKDSGNWISGFATPSYDSPLGHTEVGNSMAVLDPASIAPIVNEENPTAEVTLTDPTDPNHPDDPVVNEVIDDVIYNLPANSFDGGSGTPEDPAGAILDEVVVKDETFYENNEPGTDGFAAGFTGLVFMLAPGTGDIQIDANIREGNKLAVQIGLSDPVLLPNEDYPTVNEMATYYVPFAVTDRTYVYVYLAETPAPSRSMSEMPNREKVLHGHVKVTQLGVAASSMVNNNVYSEQENNVGRKVKLYSLPSSAVADGGNGIVLSTVALADAAASRAVRREAAPEVYPITELAPTVFDALDKSQILYIDMKGTALEDFTVNRSSGLMGGFGSNTLIYLPDKNDDGGEPNVVINKECARLSLNSDSKFRSPMAFTAAEATLNRTFTVGRTSTVFLPFALTKAQADALGTFYKFKEIDGDNAVFYDAENDGIEANKPYIFTPAAEHVSATDVAVMQVNSFSATQGNLIGTYEQIEWAVDPGNIYGFAAADDGGIKGGQFVRAAAGAWIPPFRAYLQVDNASSRLNIVISEQEPDDIRELSISREDANATYDLQGRKVSDTRQKTSALKAGLYIINGKKAIVK